MSKRETHEAGAAIAAFYRGISFDRGGAPDWASVSELFLPNARLTLPRFPGWEGICSMTIAEWGARFMEDLGRNHVIAFHEREIASTIFHFGDIAHALSSFETRIVVESVQTLRGVYSIQLARDAGGWRIVSMLWDFASDANAIPPDLVEASG